MVILKIYCLVILIFGMLASVYKAVDNRDRNLMTGIIFLIPVLLYVIMR